MRWRSRVPRACAAGLLVPPPPLGAEEGEGCGGAFAGPPSGAEEAGLLGAEPSKGATELIATRRKPRGKSTAMPLS